MTPHRPRAALAFTAALCLACLGCSGTSATPNATAHLTTTSSAPAPTTSSAPTTPPAAALIQHTVGGFAIEVPATWAESTTNNGGSSTQFTFSEPTGPEQLTASVDFCTGCIQDAAGSSTPDTVPYLQEMAHPPGATNLAFLSPDRATFNLPAENGLTTLGVVVISDDKTKAIRVEATTSADDAQLAQRIIESVH